MRQQLYVPPRRPYHWMDIFQPIEPPAHGPPPTSEIQSPIRDESKLGATEDLDREPDGVPHSIVGATAGFSIVLAILVACAWFVSDWPGRILTFVLVAIAFPVVISTLKHKADRDRDQAHPSR
jgi:hypothetical protein